MSQRALGWPHSLRLRLVVLFLALAVAISLTFLGGMRQAFWGGFDRVIKPLVSDYLDRLAADIGSPPDIGKARALVARLPISVEIDGPQVNWTSRESARHHDSRHRNQWLARATADGHHIHFGWSGESFEQHTNWVGWGTLAILLALTLAAFAWVRRLLRPLDEIRQGAIEFGKGHFSHRIQIKRRDELGVLAQQVNQMADSIEQMLEAKRALLLAISHELRSPLTRARLHAELIEAGDSRDALLSDLGLMSLLISDLLDSERLATPHTVLQTQATDLNTVVRQVLAEANWPQSLVPTLYAEVPELALDRTRVALLVRNLLANAFRHNAPGAPAVQVCSFLDTECIVLTVRDFGPGVSEAELARLTEPFYRTDSARARSTGGFGLGLYLCELIMRAHGGRLLLRNANPGLLVRCEFALDVSVAKSSH